MISKTAWSVIAAGSALTAGILVRRALDAGWRRVTDEDPPKNPVSPETEWSGALAWTAATGLLVGLGRLMARRGAANVWTRALGSRPPL